MGASSPLFVGVSFGAHTILPVPGAGSASADDTENADANRNASLRVCILEEILNVLAIKLI